MTRGTERRWTAALLLHRDPLDNEFVLQQDGDQLVLGSGGEDDRLRAKDDLIHDSGHPR